MSSSTSIPATRPPKADLRAQSCLFVEASFDKITELLGGDLALASDTCTFTGLRQSEGSLHKNVRKTCGLTKPLGWSITERNNAENLDPCTDFSAFVAVYVS